MRGPFAGKTWWQKTALTIGILIGLIGFFSDLRVPLLTVGLIIIIGETAVEIFLRSRKKPANKY